MYVQVGAVAFIVEYAKSRAVFEQLGWRLFPQVSVAHSESGLQQVAVVTTEPGQVAVARQRIYNKPHKLNSYYILVSLG